MATFNFKKRPTARNLVRRSISFNNTETSLVNPKDIVTVEIQVSNGTSIHLGQMTGRQFLSRLEDVGAIRYKVFKF